MESEVRTGWKIATLTLLNGALAALISAGVSNYFLSKSMREEQLITFRKTNIKNLKALISEAKSSIDEIEKLERQIKKEDYIPLPSGGHIMSQELHLKSIRISTLLNRLGDIGHELPYQHRVVVWTAKNHYGNLNFRKVVPESPIMNPKLERLTAMSFSLALDIATENYILDGEPRHKELAPLIGD